MVCINRIPPILIGVPKGDHTFSDGLRTKKPPWHVYIDSIVLKRISAEGKWPIHHDREQEIERKRMLLFRLNQPSCEFLNGFFQAYTVCRKDIRFLLRLLRAKGLLSSTPPSIYQKISSLPCIFRSQLTRAPESQKVVIEDSGSASRRRGYRYFSFCQEK